MNVSSMEVVNIASGVAMMAVAMPLAAKRLRRSVHPWVPVFLATTGGAWTLHFAVRAAADRSLVARGGVTESIILVLFSIVLAVASVTLVRISANQVGRDARVMWIAGGSGALTALVLFIGRGAMEVDAAMLARLARDAGLAAFVVALLLYALHARSTPHPRFAWASIALLLYPGIVAGIYLHPASHRNILALAIALALVAVLWLRNTTTRQPAASRRALIVSLSCFALPLLALATVRWQGGIDGAAEGPLRALARTAGPILYAYVVATDSAKAASQ